MNGELKIAILAEGPGDDGEAPRALRAVLFRPMLHYALDLAAQVPHGSLAVVADGSREAIRRACAGFRGVRCLSELRPAPGERGTLLVLRADLVLLGAAPLKRMLTRHARGAASCSVGTTTLADPRGRVRVLREIDGRVADIREEAECAAAERAVNEVDAGIYCFESADFFAGLDGAGLAGRGARLARVVKGMARAGKRVLSFCFGDPAQVARIDDGESLWRAESLLQARINAGLMRRGVALQDPGGIWIDPRCSIARDARIETGSVLINSVVEPRAAIEGRCRVVDSVVGAGSLLRQGSYVEGSLIGPRCSIGPYARLSPGSRVSEGERIGDYALPAIGPMMGGGL